MSVREDVQSHTRRALAQTKWISELETLLEDVKLKVQELEERCVGRAAQTHGEMQQLQSDKKQALVRKDTVTLDTFSMSSDMLCSILM